MTCKTPEKIDVVAEGGWIFIEGSNYAATFAPDQAINVAMRLCTAAVVAKAQLPWPPFHADGFNDLPPARSVLITDLMEANLLVEV